MNKLSEVHNQHLDTIRILLIEDNVVEAALIEMMLSKAKDTFFEVSQAKRLSYALDLLKNGNIDVILLDLSLPDSDGIETFMSIKDLAPHLPIVIMTALNDEMVAIEAARKGAQDYLVKGNVDYNLLVRAIRYAIERSMAEEALRKAHEELEIRVHERTKALLSEITERKQIEETLKKERDFITAVIDTVGALIVILDPKGRIIHVNNSCQSITGYTFGEVFGKYVWDIFLTPEDVWFVKAVFENLQTIHLQNEFENYWLTKNGDRRLIAWSTTAILKDDGSIENIIATGIDITERKQSEDALQESRARFRNLVEATSDWVWEVDENAVYTYAGPKIRDILGYEPEEMLGKTPFDFMPPDEASRISEIFSTIAASQKAFNLLENTNLHKDGHKVVLETSGVPYFDRHGRLCGYRGIDRDITRHKRLEKKILEISGREQRRIGQDLHDGLGQDLTGIAFLSKVLEQKLASNRIPEAAAAAEIRKLVNQAITQTRDLARILFPVKLEEYGLDSALRELVSRIENQFNISCTVRCNKPPLISDNSTATHIYRIAQEAINNAIRHGKAKNILMSLTSTNEKTSLMIKDDGLGIPEKIENDKGMGMQIMNYRSKMINGSLSIGRHDSGGTIITCSFPNRNLNEKVRSYGYRDKR